MKISELIVVLKQEMEKHGDIAVFVDEAYGQREIEIDTDPLCPIPEYQPATKHMFARLLL